MDPTLVAQVFRRRWWLLLLVLAAAVGASLVYSGAQPREYDAAATLLARPSPSLTTPGESLNEVNLLSYGSVMATVASLGESASLRARAAGETGVEASRYRATAVLLTRSTVVRLSVRGPGVAATVRLVDQLAGDVSADASASFPTVLVTPLDEATSSELVRPRTGQNALFAGLAGAVVAWVTAVWSLRTRRMSPEAATRAVESRSGRPVRRRRRDTGPEPGPGGDAVGAGVASQPRPG